MGVAESPDDDHYFRIVYDRSQVEIAAKLEELKTAILRGELKAVNFQGLKAIWSKRHLYQPLLCVDGKIVEISPAPLNKGERRFIEDLTAFHDRDSDFFQGSELYLLRNLSKGRGVEFFEAGNFHPDFILWLLIGNQQRVLFVDPKGIRNLGSTDPKIRLYEEVKKIERRLGDPNGRLESFIVSNTPSHTMKRLWSMPKTDMQSKHILFQEEDQDTYIRTMLEHAR